MITIKLEAYGTYHRKDKKLHRHEGPAFYKNDSVHNSYWVNAKNHRIEGPARIFANRVEYCVCDTYYEKKVFDLKYKPCILINGHLNVYETP